MFQASMFCNRQSLCDSCKFRSRSNILSIYQSIYLSIYPSIHPSIYLLASLHLWRWNRQKFSHSVASKLRLNWSVLGLLSAAASRSRRLRNARTSGVSKLSSLDESSLGASARSWCVSFSWGQDRMAAMGNPVKMKAFWWEKKWKKTGTIMEIMGTIINRWRILWSLSENGGIPPNSQRRYKSL